MVQRYTKLETGLNSLGHGILVEVGNQPLLLRRAESERAHALLKMLTDFEGVTKTLQRSMLTLSGARCLFDLVCQRYTQLKPRLSPTADIVNYVALETGIVKLQWKEPLTAAERVACADFDVPIVERRRQPFITVYVGAFVGPASVQEMQDLEALAV
ncbi:hypothetical protein PC121_g20073 [Phytophthora cactorum]|nr:hypothetical protein PC120_g21297 [Phytophthora cactorum]KAG3047417.1 hypothetical protein PC121_g20073 [Phytophthora cactorum]